MPIVKKKYLDSLKVALLFMRKAIMESIRYISFRTGCLQPDLVKSGNLNIYAGPLVSKTCLNQVFTVDNCLALLLLIVFMIPGFNALAQRDKKAGISNKKSKAATAKAIEQPGIDSLRKLFEKPVSSIASLAFKRSNERFHKNPLAPALLSDTLPISKAIKDSIVSTSAKLLSAAATSVKDQSQRKLASVKELTHFKKDDLVNVKLNNPFPEFKPAKPFLKLTSGHAGYFFNYNSYVDTPFVETALAQHTLSGSMNLSVATIFPIRVTYLIQRTNSSIFADVTNVQVSFNGAAFRDQLQTAYKKRLLAAADNLKDSLTGKLYALKKIQLDDKKSWLNNPFNKQKLIEANEIIHVPGITHDLSLPDSMNLKIADSLKAKAAAFIALYKKLEGEHDRIKSQVDSLQQIYKTNLDRIEEFKRQANGQPQLADLARKKVKVPPSGPSLPAVPDKYRWLLGIRDLSVGRSLVNYSELTAKNISLRGVNFEYNSWYYVAVSAGLIDYRFRDFVISTRNRIPQYVYLLRLGIGNLERNYFILSAYHGKKQLFASVNNSSKNASVEITGFSAETKIRLNRFSHLTMEVAQSSMPGNNANPLRQSPKTAIVDKTNKAFTARLFSVIPKTNSRVDAMYKYMGVNFQSFSTFQTNTAVKAWYVKFEQEFLKRKLRITTALRSNEFTNPYVVQQYKANTIFKTVNVSFRARKWPTLMVGYIPASQLTSIDGTLAESRFQTLTASANHFYKMGSQRATTTLVYNKFYNTDTDTGFIYFNSANMYFMQSFIFGLFTANVGITHSKNNQHEWNGMEQGFTIGFRKQASLGFGVKLNNLNWREVKAGGYINTNVQVVKNGLLYLSLERMYLPGSGNQLVRNEMATIQFTKYF